MDGDERQIMLVVDDMTSELGASILNAEIRTKEQRLLRDEVDGSSIVLEKPTPAGSRRQKEHISREKLQLWQSHVT